MAPENQTPFISLASHPDGTGSIVKITEGTSLRGTIFNLLNTMIGAGVLGLPFAVQQNGLLLGSILLVLVAAFTDISSWMLLISVDVTQELSYAMVAERLYGRWLGVCVDLAVCLNNLGILISYIVVIGDLIPPFMTHLHAPDVLQDHTVLVCAVTFFALLPLSLLPSMGALRHASLVCLLMIFLFSLVIIAMGVGFIDVSQTSDEDLVMVSASSQAVLGQMSVMLFAYNCLMNVPFLYGELRRKSRKMVDSRFETKRSKMMYAIHISMSLCSLVYVVVGDFGYSAFHEKVKSDILKNLQSDTFYPAPYVKVSYSMVIICSYPVMCFSCVASLHRLLQQLLTGGRTSNGSPWSPASTPKAELWSAESNAKLGVIPDTLPSGNTSDSSAAAPSGTVRVMLVVCTVLATLVIGLSVPDVSIVFALTGGICGGSLVFTFPGLFFLRLPSGVSRRCRICLGQIFFWAGIVISIATTLISVQTSFSA